MKAYNIMEDIVKKYLDEMLVLRYDICTCKLCREDIIAYVLSRIPPKYVTTDSGAMHTLMEQLKLEQASQILREIVNGIQNISQKPRHKVEADRELAYKLLIKQIMIDRGADFSQYRDRILKRRIALRMREKKANSYSEYLQILIHQPEEYEKLFEVLTINVSSFFRDTEVWLRLKSKIIPDLIQRKKERGLRKIKIWSAGCANGEEAYSLAITLYEILEKEGRIQDAEVVATDIDKESLILAEQGAYGRESIKNVSAERLKRFFIPYKEKFRIVPHLKELVKFVENNLITETGLGGLDIILCRNVFIYFNRSLQEYLIMKFYNALLDDGYFVMGNSENLLGEARELFKEIDGPCRIYQKIKR